MPLDPARVKAVFSAALERLNPGERAAYLDEQCGADIELRARIEALLRAGEASDSFLGTIDSDLPTGAFGQAAPAPTETITAATAEVPGSTIAGRFKLIQEIGEGGMGSVWMAEQTEPVKRLVALKLIKPGMDSKTVLVRFEAERQALAMMDHPNIARVLDGGTTELGRPYFVMELVKGIPINTYCDERQLTVRQRLDLFIAVCQAVQHAHQKGIIHRDLKPSNVLVTEYDGKPVPKVIDFGLAKALQGPATLTDQTLYTAFGAAVGTPLYMAPEQVGINALDIDTRTDIYALGVLLYELLTGTTPLQRQRFKEAAWDEICRLIREEEPPRPSIRLSSLDALPSIAARRQTEPGRLGRQVRGDLDWIAMKALEKDRNRRYETANGFAMDIQRFLADEPVLAGPPGASYRLKKFVRRNRRGVWVAAAFGLLLLIGFVGLAIGLAVLSAQKRELAAQKGELERAIAAEEASRRKADENFREARMAVDRFFTEVSTSPQLLRGAPGTQLLRRRLLEQARDYYVKFLGAGGDDPKLREDVARAHLRMGQVLAETGNGPEARQSLEQGRGLAEEALRADPANRSLRQEVAQGTWLTAIQEGLAGKLSESRVKLLQAHGQFEQLLKEEPVDRETERMLADVCRDLGELESLSGNVADATKWFRSALRHSGGDPFLDGLCHSGLARTHRFQGRFRDALTAAETARSLMMKAAAASPDSLSVTLQLAKMDTLIGQIQQRLGNFPESAAAHSRARTRLEPLARDNLDVRDIQSAFTAAIGNEGLITLEQGQPASARLLLREARRRYEKFLKDGGRNTEAVNDWLTCCYYLGVAERAINDLPAAREVLGAATAKAGDIRAQFPNNLPLHNDLVRCWFALGEAERTVNNFDAALAAFDSGLKLIRELNARQSRIPDYTQNLVVMLGRRGEMLAALNKPNQGEADLAEAIAVADAWRTWDEQSVAARNVLIAVLGRRAELRLGRCQFADTIPDLDRVIALSGEPYKSRASSLRALALARLGRFADLAAEAERLDRGVGRDLEAIYNAACAFAVAVADMDAVRKEAAAKRAIDLLQRGKAAGDFETPARIAHLKQDPDLNPIRQRAGFRQFLTELDKKREPMPKPK